MKGRKTKSISFDLTDDYEVKLLKYAESKEDKGKFSRYIKRLIAQDRDGGARVYSAPAVVEQDENGDDDLMDGYL